MKYVKCRLIDLIEPIKTNYNFAAYFPGGFCRQARLIVPMPNLSEDRVGIFFRWCYSKKTLYIKSPLELLSGVDRPFLSFLSYDEQPNTEFFKNHYNITPDGRVIYNEEVLLSVDTIKELINIIKKESWEFYESLCIDNSVFQYYDRSVK